MSNYIASGAVISACGNYRYSLFREWRLGNSTQWDMWTDDDGWPIVDGEGKQLGDPLSCVFVMLNPSTADADQDDPTIRRCVGFAKAWGYDRLDVVNLFAWRATNPQDVLAMTGGKTDPVGRDNRLYVHRAIERAGIVVCAWGAHGGHIDQDETMLGWLEEHGAEPMALKLTKDRFPSHPLYLPADSKPFRYFGRQGGAA